MIRLDMPAASPLQVSRILHAGYIFDYAGTAIAFDPIFENPFSHNCYSFPKIAFDLEQIKKIKFAAVFISHFHDDHCSLESLNLLDRETLIYVYCLHEELFTWIRELGFTHVYPLKLGQSVQVGAFEITPGRALDAEVDSLFQIKVAGLQILNVVDSWIDEEMLDELVGAGTWDLILWPFQTMREIEVLAPLRASPAPRELPPEWLAQLRVLKPLFLVPSSCQFIHEEWSWYRQAFFPISYAIFQSEIIKNLPATQVIRLDPGTSIELNGRSLRPSTPLPWIQRLEQAPVDYEYRPELKPPPTCEIARHFSELRVEQMQLVEDYCQQGLIQKFNSMDPPLDPYFAKTRSWRLTLFNQTGTAHDFFYEINPGGLKRITEPRLPLGWTTEIAAAKLYAALELGESLTSLYVRINDVEFAPAIEKEIQEADIIEDPLIRCLFNGCFGAFQKAQLKRIKERQKLNRGK